MTENELEELRWGDGRRGYVTARELFPMHQIMLSGAKNITFDLIVLKC